MDKRVSQRIDIMRQTVRTEVPVTENYPTKPIAKNFGFSTPSNPTMGNCSIVNIPTKDT
jgi:hypothetical protein